MNKQIVGGNLTSAAVVINKDDRDMLAFTVASNNGPDYTDYFNCTVWGPKGFAENVLPYLAKGQAVTTHGELVYPAATEKDGVVYNNVLIQVKSLRDVQMIGGKVAQSADKVDAPTPAEAQVNAQAAEAAKMASTNPAPANENDSYDDIPF